MEFEGNRKCHAIQRLSKSRLGNTRMYATDDVLNLSVQGRGKDTKRERGKIGREREKMTVGRSGVERGA